MYFVGKTYDQGAFSSSALYPIEIVKNRLQTLQVCVCADGRESETETERGRDRCQHVHVWVYSNEIFVYVDR